jgi:hypothetical protein
MHEWLTNVFSSVVDLATKASPSPVPVYVVDKAPEGPWAIFGAIFAGAAALFAGIAVIVAIITLRRIGEQIALAEKEVTLVDQDLRNNKRMIDEALRHPDLRPIPHPRLYTSVVQVENAAYFSLNLVTNAANVGERVARHLAAEWLVPAALIPNAAVLPKRSLSEEEHCIIEVPFRSDLIFWPNGVPNQVERQLVFTVHTHEASLLLRFYDDAGTYPRGGWYPYFYKVEPNEDRRLSRVTLEPLFSLLQPDST